MPKRVWLLVLATTFVGSVIGGMLAERMFVSGLVHAEKPNAQNAEKPDAVHAEKPNAVNAEEFLLVDQSGKARGGLGLDPSGEVGLVMTSRDGNRKLALSPDGPFAVKLTDRSGRVLWSAP